MRDRVLFRYFLAREQLTPALDHLEKLVLSEKWDEAGRAMDELTKKLGFRLGVRDADSVRIHSEWVHNLNRSDQERVIGFANTLQNINMVIRYPTQKREVMWIEAQFRSAREDMKWVNDKMRDDTDAVKVDGFTVFFTEGASNAEAPIETLKKAADLIRPKFHEVLYGKVYIREGLRDKGTAGSYVAATDTVNLSMYATPNRNSVDTLIHEFGHRYEERFLSHEKRKEFVQLYEIGDLKPVAFTHAQRQKSAEAMFSRWKKQRDDENYDWETIDEADRAWLDAYPRERYKFYVLPLKKEFDEGKPVDKELLSALGRLNEPGDVIVSTEQHPSPLYASEYGSTSWKENFAESFLHFIMHRPLPDGLQRFMAAL